MEIIDAQVHLWEKNNRERPWNLSNIRNSTAPAEVMETYTEREMTSTYMLEEMDRIGVDAAIAVSSSMMYGFDSSYVFSAAAQCPDKFGVVGPVDPSRPDVEDIVTNWRSRPGGLGLRVVPALVQLQLGGYSKLFRAAERAAVPICIYLPGHLEQIGVIAGSYPNLQLVIDHLGMPVTSDPAWSDLSNLIALARFPNIALKATAVPMHSVEAYPFSDIWLPLHQIISAFGVDRMIWGSDWTRVTSYDYCEGLRYIQETSELSSSEKELILGINLRRVFRWS